MVNNWFAVWSLEMVGEREVVVTGGMGQLGNITRGGTQEGGALQLEHLTEISSWKRGSGWMYYYVNLILNKKH